MTHDVERVLADIDADHGDRCVEFLRHGVLLVLSAPCQLLVLAGPEHGRTIQLADMNSAADPTWLRGAFRRRLSVAAYKHCNCLAERPEKSQNSRSVVSFGSRLSATRWI